MMSIRLQPYSPEHWLALFEGDAAFARSFGMPMAPTLRALIGSAEMSPKFLQQLREARSADPWLHGFALIDCECKLVIGSAGFKGAPDEDGMVEIAYGIASAFEGRGYATEAARQLISFALSDPRVRLIRAHTKSENAASARVLMKNDMVNVGEVVDPEDGPVCRWERRHDSNHPPLSSEDSGGR